MTEDQAERLASAFDKIASALGGLHEEIRRAGKRYWPEPGPQREVVITRVPTEEDKIRERQGANISTEEWLRNLGTPEEDDNSVGERSRQWIIDHPEENQKTKIFDAGAKAASIGKQDDSGPEKTESKT